MSAEASSLPDALGQKAFSAALLDPKLEPPTDLGKANGPAPKRFAVYRNNVIVSLIEALRQAYPSLHAIMGSENFGKVAGIYVRSHPPKSAMMQKYGRDFPDFLCSFRPLAKSPFLVDLAKAEGAWLEAWHAVDGPVLSPEELAAFPQEQVTEIRLTPHPAASLHQSKFPLFDLFNARERWPCPGINLNQGQNILITRPELQCQVFAIDEGQVSFFDSLLNNNTLGEAITVATGVDPDFDASTAISLALQSGTFFKLSTTKTTKQHTK